MGRSNTRIMTTKEGYELEYGDGSVFHQDIKSKTEAYRTFRKVIIPIINDYLSKIENDRMRGFKRQYFKEFFDTYMPEK